MQLVILAGISSNEFKIYSVVTPGSIKTALMGM
jgi:hypothetical protein